jgi:hypothetical protein
MIHNNMSNPNSNVTTADDHFNMLELDLGLGSYCYDSTLTNETKSDDFILDAGVTPLNVLSLVSEPDSTPATAFRFGESRGETDLRLAISDPISIYFQNVNRLRSKTRELNKFFS